MKERLARSLSLPPLAALSCHPPSATHPPPQPPTPPPSYPWAKATLARLSLAEKVAQLSGVRVTGLPRHPSSAPAMRLRELVQKLKVGTVVVFESEVGTLPRLLDELQQSADLPLLVAADMERGIAFRVRRGVVPLPFAMAIGATRSEDAARFCGEVAAREGRALGIHWAFAPVADVNNNPANPVINIRSFGEDPELVARLVAAFVRGAREGGLLTTAKHFPGHGDTAVDSHLQLAKVGADRARLDAVELKPFRSAVTEGQLSMERIDASVLRILETKERLGLHRSRLVDADAAAKSLARPEDVARAADIARASITVVRNEGGVLPLRAEEPLRLLHLVLSSDARNPLIQGIPEEELEERRLPTETVNLGPEVSEETTAALVEKARSATHVLASCFVRVAGSKGTADMAPSHARLLEAIAATGRPLIVLSFGSPYLLRQFPEVPVYLAAYGGAESSQRAAMAALFGEYAVRGKLPVTLPGLYAYGHGIEIPRRE